ncbi:hypothetical protein [Ferrithrix thermotolerans]|uniref:hypothetical protein n=1 Tax=Ferrithrix thermotolerans TaxID=209649 RepID=UPI001160B1F6|nr:hypothetical protein [Ferrithrix thermotolerans]
MKPSPPGCGPLPWSICAGVIRQANKQGWSADERHIQGLRRNAGLKVPYQKRKKPTHGKGIAMGVRQPTETNVYRAMDFLL